ncbi:MAG: hypothetical protein AB7T37_13320 [Dehalococcoidia bacterium]
MYVPRVRHGFDVPRPLITALTVLCAILTAVLAAALFVRSTSDDGPLGLPGAALLAPTTAIAYAVREGSFDSIYVRSLDGSGSPRLLESFPVLFNLRVRGSAAPSGDTLAILHIDSGLGAEARLSLVDVATGETRDIEGGFDYLSSMAWHPGGQSLVVTRSVAPDDPARGAILVEVDVPTLAARERHTFSGANRVHPVGYTADGSGIFVVVIDQAGSTLWSVSDGPPVRVASLSPGLTRDWALSPDASRLAFIDRLGAGGRSQAGRVLIIATGAIADAGLSGDQFGAAWRPGAAVPDFGGPEGTVRLSAAREGQYLAPIAWAPDGAHLVASVFVPGEAGAPATERIEILSAAQRVRLAEQDSAAFLGLVRHD